jgi:hypothetical protein
MKAIKEAISMDEQNSEIQVEQDSDSKNEPENETSEETFYHPAPIRIASSSMGACSSPNSNNNNHNNIARLQQSYGNLATLRLLNNKLAIQPKLKITQPQDRYEQEARRVADDAINIFEPRNFANHEEDYLGLATAARHAKISAENMQLESKAASGSEKGGPEDKSLKKFSTNEPDSKKIPISTNEISANYLPLENGRPLDENTQLKFESYFDHDLSNIRVHTDTKAAESARSLNSLAYTIGNHLVFDKGQYAPDTSSGHRLLAHELTHTIQQQNVSPFIARNDPPAGHIATPDPDWPYIPDPEAPDPDEADMPIQTHRNFPFLTALEDPTLFIVPEEASRTDIAYRLLGDESLDGLIDLVASRGSIMAILQAGQAVRIRDYSRLQDEPYGVLRRRLDRAIDRDVNWTVSKLSERIISSDDESDLAEMALKWSQRSEITDASGVQYFDRYLNALDSRILVSFWGTRQSALRWLLDEVPSRRELIRKAMELRSSRTTGYQVTDRRPQFQEGDVIGRFFYSNRVHGDSIQLKISQTIAEEESFERAERVTRNNHHSRMRVVIPGTGRQHYGYTIVTDHRMPRSKHDMDLRQNPMRDPGGQFYWYYPGTIFIGPNEFQPEYAEGNEAAQVHRRNILEAALTGASSRDISSIVSLDFEVLATARNSERVRLMNYVLEGRGKDRPEGVALLTRIILSTPNTDFHAFERTISTDGTMDRLFRMSNTMPSLSVVGRAFTLKALQAMPIGVEAVQSMETFQLGEDDDGVYHFAFSDTVRRESNVVAASEWNPRAAARLGSEPGLPGEAGGRITRNTIRLQVAELRGGMWQLITNPSGTVRNSGPLSRPFLPTELVRIEVIGAAPRTLIVTALEAAGILDLSFQEYTSRIIIPAANISLWAMAFGRLATAFGPALLQGISTGGLSAGLRALAGHAASEAGRQALRTFAFEALLLGSMQAVDAYRDELQQSEAGRAFLALYDVVMVALIGREIYRLAASGVIGRLARLGVRAMGAVGRTGRAALRRTITELQAFDRAWTRYLAQGGETVRAAEGGAAILRPANPESFNQIWMASRAEAYSSTLISTLREAGHSTTVAERVLERLQGISATSKEMARAQAALADRAAGMTGAQVDNLFSAVERTLNSPRGLNTELAGWFRGAARAGDSIAYLGEVDILIARRGVSAEAIEVLGAKAGRNQVDIFWLNRTHLTDRDLSFLGRDQRTPWRWYQAVASDPSLVTGPTIGLVRGSIRGAAAELFAQRNFRNILPNFRIRGRQVSMGSSFIDFEIVEQGLGRRFGLEIKGWTPQTWREALSAYRARALAQTTGATLTEAQTRAVAKIDNMLTQLRNIQAHTGNHPYLGISGSMRSTDRTALIDLLQAEGLGGTQFVNLTESEIVEMGRRLRAALNLPF